MYAGEAYRYGEAPNLFVAEQTNELCGSGKLKPALSRAIDVAAGEGRNACFLAELGFSTTAIDASAEGIAKAVALSEKKGVTLDPIVADVFDWKSPVGYHLVVSTFLHLRDQSPVDVLRRLEALLLPGGYLIAELFHPDQRRGGYKSGGPPSPEMMTTPEDVQRALESSTLLTNQVVKRFLEEGPGHRGEGVVTQVVAMRR